jgi:hypothetical protein
MNGFGGPGTARPGVPQTDIFFQCLPSNWIIPRKIEVTELRRGVEYSTLFLAREISRAFPSTQISSVFLRLQRVLRNKSKRF